MFNYKKWSRQLARTAVSLIPNSKVLRGLADMYTEKYHNFRNIDIYTNGEYRWLKQAINALKDPIVFDVGANIGDWTNHVLEINPSAIIHAFEPTPTTFELLAERNFPQTVHINNIGLGSEKRVLAFYQYGKGHKHNSFYPHHDNPYHNKIDVPVETIESYCHQHDISHINYLKIDTEGHDYYVMLGAKSFFENEQVDIVQFEYGSKYIDARVFLKDVFDFIAPLNYSIYRIMTKNLLHLPSYENTYEKFIYSNYTIIHNPLAERLTR